MKIENKITGLVIKITPLYFVEINEGSTIAYLTKTKTGTYDFTSEHKQAWLFDDLTPITEIKLIKNLYYNIINFNDLYIPRYNVYIQPDNAIYTSISWTAIGSNDTETPTHISTTNPDKAKQKLEQFQYQTVHALQKQICDVYEKKISIPEVVR